MKGIKYTTYLALWVVALFTGAMVVTYFSDFLQSSGFFGDVKLAAPDKSISEFSVDVWYDWGARHYWYYWMCFLLFVISIIRIVFWSIAYWDDDESK